jgi:hypothetical protein
MMTEVNLFVNPFQSDVVSTSPIAYKRRLSSDNQKSNVLGWLLCAFIRYKDSDSTAISKSFVIKISKKNVSVLNSSEFIGI